MIENYIFQHKNTLKQTDIEMIFGASKCKRIGIAHSSRIGHRIVKDHLLEGFTRCVTKTLKTKLNSRNIAKAINSYVITVPTYHFGIIDWSNTELDGVNKKIRTLITRFSITPELQ